MCMYVGKKEIRSLALWYLSKFMPVSRRPKRAFARGRERERERERPAGSETMFKHFGLRTAVAEIYAAAAVCVYSIIDIYIFVGRRCLGKRAVRICVHE